MNKYIYDCLNNLSLIFSQPILKFKLRDDLGNDYIPKFKTEFAYNNPTHGWTVTYNSDLNKFEYRKTDIEEKFDDTLTTLSITKIYDDKLEKNVPYNIIELSDLVKHMYVNEFLTFKSYINGLVLCDCNYEELLTMDLSINNHYNRNCLEVGDKFYLKINIELLLT